VDWIGLGWVGFYTDELVFIVRTRTSQLRRKNWQRQLATTFSVKESRHSYKSQSAESS